MLLPGELTIAEQIERSGAPDLLLELYPGASSTTSRGTSGAKSRTCSAAWSTSRRSTRSLREHGHGDLRLVDNGVVNRRSPALADLAHVRGYHLVPAGASKAAAVALHRRARGYARDGDVRDRRLARGSRVRRPRWRSSGWSPTPSSATRRSARRSPRTTTCGSPRPATAAGVYEAVVSTLRAERLLTAARPISAGPKRGCACQQAPRQPGRRAPARGRRDGRAHERDPVVERQLAGDQPPERASDRRLNAGALERRAEQRHGLERLDGLADAAPGSPRPSRPRPAAHRRGGCGSSRASAVATRSPVPASPIIDSGRAPSPSA